MSAAHAPESSHRARTARNSMAGLARERIRAGDFAVGDLTRRIFGVRTAALGRTDRRRARVGAPVRDPARSRFSASPAASAARRTDLAHRTAPAGLTARYVQLVGDREQARCRPQPGTAVYTQLSGRFDRLVQSITRELDFESSTELSPAGITAPRRTESDLVPGGSVSISNEIDGLSARFPAGDEIPRRRASSAEIRSGRTCGDAPGSRRRGDRRETRVLGSTALAMAGCSVGFASGFHALRGEPAGKFLSAPWPSR